MREFHRNFHKVLLAFVPSLCSSKSKILPRQHALPLIPELPIPASRQVFQLADPKGAACSVGPTGGPVTQAEPLPPGFRCPRACGEVVTAPKDTRSQFLELFLEMKVIFRGKDFAGVI